MSDTQKIERQNIIDALEAFRTGSPSELVDAISMLTEPEKLCVKIIQELTSAPTKAKRGRPEGSKNRTPASKPNGAAQQQAS